ncbi:hypothetical protein [Streptomyces sp. V3I7]|uniref:hypothetical protein n=1 Tax=Streptomyces sp. V3I7 TaxID=3042278 RepID=UPI0027824046|nr:hypothetical protein [Streptomyces sp. V3I7]MDQ0994733.1 hypothetical protein [Streptomyces sp. V3I7]
MGNQAPRSPLKTAVAVILAITAAAAPAALTNVFSSDWHRFDAATSTVIAGVTFAIWQSVKEVRSIEQVRARVHEAERSVEGALSGPAARPVGRLPRPSSSQDSDEPGRNRSAHPEQSEAETEARRERRDLALARLWTLTRRRLDLYHQIAPNQARRSFISAQVSIIVGFALLLNLIG